MDRRTGRRFDPNTRLSRGEWHGQALASITLPAPSRCVWPVARRAEGGAIFQYGQRSPAEVAAVAPRAETTTRVRR